MFGMPERFVVQVANTVLFCQELPPSSDSLNLAVILDKTEREIGRFVKDPTGITLFSTNKQNGSQQLPRTLQGF
ncbi:MAG: hypothetical protein CMP20_15825 [Rickettsiales bacterium]|nr:hypothetical protein [Rickettsiales bacterium]